MILSSLFISLVVCALNKVISFLVKPKMYSEAYDRYLYVATTGNRWSIADVVDSPTPIINSQNEASKDLPVLDTWVYNPSGTITNNVISVESLGKQGKYRWSQSTGNHLHC